MTATSCVHIGKNNKTKNNNSKQHNYKYDRNPLGPTEGSLNLSTTLERFLIDIDPSRRTYWYLKIKNIAQTLYCTT